MSSIKTFVYRHRETHEVIFTKKSLRYDYTIELPQVYTICTGIPVYPAPGIPGFLRKKIEAIIFLRTTECMMLEQIEKTLKTDSTNPIYLELFNTERRLAKERVQKFFSEKQKAVIACTSSEAIAQFMKEMSDRVNLGVYSVMNQERKNLDGVI